MPPFNKTKHKRQLSQTRQRRNSTGNIRRNSLFLLKANSLKGRISKNLERFVGKNQIGDIVGSGGLNSTYESVNWRDEKGSQMLVTINPNKGRPSADSSPTDDTVNSLLNNLRRIAEQNDTEETLPETIIIKTVDSTETRQDAQHIIRDLLNEQQDTFESSEPEIVKLEDGQVGLVFSISKKPPKTNHTIARELTSQNNLKNTELFTHFGGGVNKQAYGINGQPWVALVTDPSKQRLLRSEVDQILALKKAGLDTPLLGVDPENPDDAIFDVTLNGKRMIGFLEEKVDGFEIPREGKTAFDDGDIKKFGEQIVDFLAGQSDPETAQKKRLAALNSIQKLETYLNREGAEDIPDFQVRLDKNTGRILTLDPGDPLNSENALEKHKRWIANWKKILTDDRYMNRMWNNSNPGKKTKLADWVGQGE